MIKPDGILDLNPNNLAASTVLSMQLYSLAMLMCLALPVLSLCFALQFILRAHIDGRTLSSYSKSIFLLFSIFAWGIFANDFVGRSNREKFRGYRECLNYYFSYAEIDDYRSVCQSQLTAISLVTPLESLVISLHLLGNLFLLVDVTCRKGRSLYATGLFYPPPTWDQDKEKLYQQIATGTDGFLDNIVPSYVDELAKHENFCCTIGFDIIRDPVYLLMYDKRTYFERLALEKWLIEKQTHPLCRRRVRFNEVYADPALKQLIHNKVAAARVMSTGAATAFLPGFTTGKERNRSASARHHYKLRHSKVMPSISTY